MSRWRWFWTESTFIEWVEKVRYCRGIIGLLFWAVAGVLLGVLLNLGAG